jgi:hypothetical protein
VKSVDRKRLAAMIERELEEPREPARLQDELREELPELAPALRLLALKDEEHRTAFYVKSEGLWYRRFGFRMMRPLLLVGVLAAVGFLLQRAVDPALGLACFAAGAFAFYIVLQIFAWRWSRQDEGRLAALRDRYRLRLEALRDELREETTGEQR